MSKDTKSESGFWSTIRPFVFGGLSGMFATSCVMPIDNIKINIQTFAETAGIKHTKIEARNPYKAAKKIFKRDGIWGFYRGIDAGVTRQGVYATVRFGTYKSLTERVRNTGRELTSTERVQFAVISGFIGTIFGNPLDLILVRMQSDTTLPVEKRRNYKHLFDAVLRIPKEEGITTLWRGFPSFALRGMATTCAQLATFEEMKLLISKVRGEDEADFLTRLMYISSNLKGSQLCWTCSNCSRASI